MTWARTAAPASSCPSGSRAWTWRPGSRGTALPIENRHGSWPRSPRPRATPTGGASATGEPRRRSTARIIRDRPSHRESARIVAEIAEALGHAHRMGFVHRDIKPANILLDHRGRAYLTDFVIAVVEEELLRDVGAAGTLPYMAPEQLD